MLTRSRDHSNQLQYCSPPISMHTFKSTMELRNSGLLFNCVVADHAQICPVIKKIDKALQWIS